MIAPARLRQLLVGGLTTTLLAWGGTPAPLGAADLADVFDAVVAVHATIPGDARTAEFLGTEREGSGAIIGDDGLVLTIGYLILEADTAEITTADGRTVPADIVAYDHATGFGLLRPLQALGIAPLALGNSGELAEDAKALIVSQGGAAAAQGVIVAARRQFAGYWEYLLDDAIFTTPPNLSYGGAALIGAEGTLLGIGSLLVPDVFGRPHGLPGNMFVPIDALKPILDQLIARGRQIAPPRPWIGVFAEEVDNRVIVSYVAAGGPAAATGLSPGDIILKVGDTAVSSLAAFYQAMWALGDAGTEIPLTVLQGAETRQLTPISKSRYEWLRIGRSY